MVKLPARDRVEAEAPVEALRRLIPPGRYVAVIEKSLLKTTKCGTGKYLELVFRIVEGGHADRRVWKRLNLRNANPLTESIAHRDLWGICRAAGVPDATESEQLQGRPLVIRVHWEPRANTDRIYNVVTDWEPYDPDPWDQG